MKYNNNNCVDEPDLVMSETEASFVITHISQDRMSGAKLCNQFTRQPIGSHKGANLDSDKTAGAQEHQQSAGIECEVDFPTRQFLEVGKGSSESFAGDYRGTNSPGKDRSAGEMLSSYHSSREQVLKAVREDARRSLKTEPS